MSEQFPSGPVNCHSRLFQGRNLVTCMMTAVSLGITIRFWKEMLSPSPFRVMNRSPVYWILGLVISAYSLERTLRQRKRFTRLEGWVIAALNAASFLSLLSVPAYFIWTAL